MNWPDVITGAVGALAAVATVALGIRLRGKAPPSGAGLRGVGRPKPPPVKP